MALCRAAVKAEHSAMKILRNGLPKPSVEWSGGGSSRVNLMRSVQQASDPGSGLR